MIQMTQYASTGVAVNEFYLKLTDNETLSVTMGLGYKPLISLYSQLSKRAYNFYPLVMNNTLDERYTLLSVLNFPADSAPSIGDPVNGVLVMGTETTPYGIYELNIYASTTTYLDPNYPIIMNRAYTGLVNLSPHQASQEAVKYTEYDNNEDDYNSIYITN
jgi:hypothetical protein